MKFKTLIFSLLIILSFPLSAQFFTTLPAYADEDYIEKTPYIIISEGYPNALSHRMKEYIQQELFFSHRKFEVGDYRHDLWEADYGFKFQITIVCNSVEDITCNYVFTGPDSLYSVADLYNYLDSGILKGNRNELSRMAIIIVQEFNNIVDIVYTTFVKGVQKQLGMKNLDGVLGTQTRRCIKEFQIFLVTRSKIQGESHPSLTGSLNLKTIKYLSDNHPEWSHRYPMEYFTCR